MSESVWACDECEWAVPYQSDDEPPWVSAKASDFHEVYTGHHTSCVEVDEESENVMINVTLHCVDCGAAMLAGVFDITTCEQRIPMNRLYGNGVCSHRYVEMRVRRV